MILVDLREIVLGFIIICHILMFVRTKVEKAEIILSQLRLNLGVLFSYYLNVLAPE